MNFRSIVFASTLLCSSLCASPLQFSSNPKSILDPQLCDMVYRRFYFIERLKRGIALLNHQHTKRGVPKSLIKKVIVDLEVQLVPQHGRIKACIQELKQDYSLVAIFKLWNTLTIYKDIGDRLLMEEFSRLIFVIYKNLLINYQDINRSHALLSDWVRIVQGTSTAFLLDCLDICVQDLHEMKQRDPYGVALPVPLLPTKDDAAVKIDIDTHLITTRFFYIHRLEKALEILQKIDQCKLLSLQANRTKVTPLDITQCNHAFIQNCLLKINSTGSLKPILRVWDHVREYKFIEDTQFIKDFIYSALIIFRQVTPLLPAHYTDESAPISQILHLDIDTIPIFELLDALDQLVELFDDQPDQKEKLSWSEWIRQQWWAPPLIIAAIVYSIVNQPRPTY